MKLLIATNDPVRGTALSDGLRALGHFVLRAWSAGEAVVLARREQPTLVIIDRCHGDDGDAVKLADHLLESNRNVLWLGHSAELSPGPPGVLAALLQPPCDPRRVDAAISNVARRRIDPDAVIKVPGLRILSA